MAPAFRSFAIVPAAGKSRRMRQDKLLLRWGAATVIETVVGAWRASCVDHVVVVTRNGRDGFVELCQGAGATVVVADQPPPEMKDSVREALRFIGESHLPMPHDVWLLAPADMPRLSSAVIDQLLAAYNPESPAILVPVSDAKRGHPVLFPWSIAAEVEGLSDDEGVNALLKRHSLREIDSDFGSVHGDIDTPEDYERLR